MRFGAPVWPFRWDEPYDRAIRRIAAIGFQAVELIGWRPDTLDNYYTPGTVKSLRSLLDSEGVLLSQFVANPGELASGDAAERSKAVSTFRRFADIAAELGTGIINTVTHFPFGIRYPPIVNRALVQEFTVEVPAGLDWNQNWLDHVDAVRQCARYAQSIGIKYSLEMHPFRYGAAVDGILRLREAVDCPILGVNFDPSHTFPLGDMTHVAIYRLAHKLWHCDFSDNDGTTNMHFRPGKGKIDWASTMRALKEVGYDGVVSLEFEDIPGVSRGGRRVQSGAYAWNPDATPEVDREYAIALGYLKGLARDAGLAVDL